MKTCRHCHKSKAQAEEQCFGLPLVAGGTQPHSWTGTEDTENQYTVVWAYTTFAQDMTPQEAAELAVNGVFPYGDPIAGPGKVEVTVSLHGSGAEELDLGEFEVTHRVQKPTYEELLNFVQDIASWRKDDEPDVDGGEYVLENDTAVDLHDGVISDARNLIASSNPLLEG